MDLGDMDKGTIDQIAWEEKNRIIAERDRLKVELRMVKEKLSQETRRADSLYERMKKKGGEDNCGCLIQREKNYIYHTCETHKEIEREVLDCRMIQINNAVNHWKRIKALKRIKAYVTKLRSDFREHREEF